MFNGMTTIATRKSANASDIKKKFVVFCNDLFLRTANITNIFPQTVIIITKKIMILKTKFKDICLKVFCLYLILEINLSNKFLYNSIADHNTWNNYFY